VRVDKHSTLRAVAVGVSPPDVDVNTSDYSNDAGIHWGSRSGSIYGGGTAMYKGWHGGPGYGFMAVGFRFESRLTIAVDSESNGRADVTLVLDGMLRGTHDQGAPARSARRRSLMRAIR